MHVTVPLSGSYCDATAFKEPLAAYLFCLICCFIMQTSAHHFGTCDDPALSNNGCAVDRTYSAYICANRLA